jgi:hypothetical protein
LFYFHHAEVDAEDALEAADEAAMATDSTLLNGHELKAAAPPRTRHRAALDSQASELAASQEDEAPSLKDLEVSFCSDHTADKHGRARCRVCHSLRVGFELKC